MSLYFSSLRTFGRFARLPTYVSRTSFATSAHHLEASASTTTTNTTTPATSASPPTPSKPDPTVPSPVDVPGIPRTALQAPNRADIWARSQRPRPEAMTGPRFQQTDHALQPQPAAAIDLVHKQPVRWTHDRMVSCDGGGGPAGHPRIFINVDKPEISVCNYCGLPFANEHHRNHLESLPQTSYPLV